ncbi:hypothetical protein TcasGA2_TC013856 [Tribolium castaneum]|uniref:Uncharacterized protein n=1 Tax=Tribolium castaneum TaxID=7070 RepID=D6WNQ2_TRICA|nr:hypothetical protein TcasGA2_TC013856 [Tribolium castaneum]
MCESVIRLDGGIVCLDLFLLRDGFMDWPSNIGCFFWYLTTRKKPESGQLSSPEKLLHLVDEFFD